MMQCTCGAFLPPGTDRCPVCSRSLSQRDGISIIPRLLGDRWRVERRLGHGGMGIVYLATDTQSGAEVAVKRLHPQFANESNAVTRFLREAKVLARLNHPNLVPIEAVALDDGLPLLVMKYIPGRTLSSLFKEKKKLALAEVAPIVRQLCEGCSFLHRKGFVHRDLKPSNVMVQPDGRIVLLDFGLARKVKGEVQLTEAGMVLGSAPYVSPEQVLDEPIDQRSDLYSLAVMTWELLTGDHAFPGEGAIAMMLRLTFEPKLATEHEPSIPRAVSMVLRKAMGRMPDDRHPDVDAFSSAFAAAARTDAELTQSDDTMPLERRR